MTDDYQNVATLETRKLTPAEKFRPIQFKVLIKPDKTEEYHGKIIVPDTVQDRKQIQQDKGTIIAVGGNAFKDWLDPKPEAGDKVLMSRHAGYRFFDVEEKDDQNRQGTEYRVVNDVDITIILKGEIEDGYE